MQNFVLNRKVDFPARRDSRLFGDDSKVARFCLSRMNRCLPIAVRDMQPPPAQLRVPCFRQASCNLDHRLTGMIEWISLRTVTPRTLPRRARMAHP
jgi:hypothetical protein